MKKLLFTFIIVLTLASCKKNTEPNCITWQLLYWQGTANHTTVTSNYTPYNSDKDICGSGKDTVYRGKIVAIRQVSANLYDYVSFNGPK